MLMKNCDKSNIKNIESILRSDKIKSLITNNGMTSNVYTDYITDNYAVTHLVIDNTEEGDMSDFMIELKNSIQDNINVNVKYNYLSPTSKSLVISYNESVLNDLQKNENTNNLIDKLQEKLQRLYPEIKLTITNNPVWEKGDNVFNQLIEDDYFEGNNKYNTEIEKISNLIINKLKFKLKEFNGKYDESITSLDEYKAKILNDLLDNIGITRVSSINDLKNKLKSPDLQIKLKEKLQLAKDNKQRQKLALDEFYSVRRLLNNFFKHQDINKYDITQQTKIKQYLPSLFTENKFKSDKQAYAFLKRKINTPEWGNKIFNLNTITLSFLGNNAKIGKYETLLNYFKVDKQDAVERIYNIVENELNRREKFFTSEKIQSKINAKITEDKIKADNDREQRERLKYEELNKYKNSTVVKEVEGFLGARNIHDLDEVLNSSNINVELAVIKNNGHNLDKTPNGKTSDLFKNILTLPEVNGNKEIAEKLKSLIYSDDFQNWFGDWLNNPEESSKIVDQNGEPKLVYHGSGREFSNFSKEERGSTTGKWKDRLSDSEMSFMFTDSVNTAFYYAIIERQEILKEITYYIRKAAQEPTNALIQEMYKKYPSVKNWVESLKEKGLTREEILKEFNRIYEEYNKLRDLSDGGAIGNQEDNNESTKQIITYFDNNKESILKKGIPKNDKYSTAIIPNSDKNGYPTWIWSSREYNTATVRNDGTLSSFLEKSLNGKNIQELTSDEYDLMVNEFKNNFIYNYEKIQDEIQAGGFKPKIYPVFLNAKNINQKDFKNRSFVFQIGDTQELVEKRESKGAAFEVADLIDDAIKNNLDGSIIKNIADPVVSNNYAVFEPNQIKSLFNKANYSSQDNFYNQLVDGEIIGQANIKAGTVLIDALNQKTDTLPHEYAHHYIAWFRNSPIVQEGIRKWGSEEALVQSIGEQVVLQKGEAYNWWNNFVNWILNKLNSLSKLEKQELTQILTDAFLTRKDLNDLQQEQIKKRDNEQVPNYGKEKYFENKESSTDTEILSKISESNHPLNKLAKHLIDYSNGITINLKPLTELEYKIKSGIYKGQTSTGVYSSSENTIEIAELSNKFKNTPEVLLIHEILHGITSNYINNNLDSPLIKEFDRLLEESKSKLNDSYPLTDLDEFIVGLFTDSKFISDLQKVESDNPTKYSNLFDEILDYIMSLFKINSTNSLYNDAFAVATNIIQNADTQKQQYDNSYQDFLNRTNNNSYSNDNLSNKENDTIENLVGNVLSTSDSISVNKQISKAEADDNQIIARTKAKINRLKSTLTRPGVNKYFIQSKIDNYNKELEDYKESETIQDKLEVLTNIARMDVDDAKEALKNPNSLNASEIRDIIATGDIWSNFRDILGVSELNEEVEKIQSDATQIKYDIYNVTTDFILEASKGSKFNLTVEDMTMMKDSKWMLNILDIKNSDQKFIRYLGSAIERVNIAKELSIKEKWKKSDELFSKIKREDYKKLFKTDAAGRTLWNHLIYELDDSFIGTRKELSGYADAFYKESDKEDISDYIKLYLDGDMDKANRAKKQLIEDKISTEEILDSVIKGVEEGRKEPSYTNDELTFQGLNAGSKEARRLKNQWFVDNTMAIDPIAFAEGTTEEERNRLIEEFYGKVGEKHKHYAMSMVDLAQAKIKQYYEEQKQYQEWLEDTYIDNSELAEEQMKLWEYRHNPFLYYNITYNPSALPEDTDMEAINQTKDKDKLRYVPYAPVGDQHYNPKFKEMLANKDLFAVYDFVNSYMRAAVKRLPKDIRGNTNADFVMRSKAGAWEAFKANNYKPVQGLDGATDWFSVNHSYQFDNEVDELGNPLNKVRFDKFFDVDARINEVERLLEQPGITDSERKIYQQELKELNKGFSTDLQSTMQMIIHEVETYKYLDDISDAVELQRYIVNQAKEITNDGYRNDGLNLIKKAVNYTFDAMVYGKYRTEPDQHQKEDFWADNVYEFKDLFGLTSEKKKQAKKIKDNAKDMEPMFEAAMLKQKAGEKLTKDEKDVITSYKNLYRDYKALGGKRSSFTKIADSAIALTQAKSMGFSILSPLTNLNFGLASNYMEAIGGLYFNVKEAHAAFKEMLSTTKNFGSLGKAKSSDKRNKIVNFFENNNLIKDMMESHYGKGQIVNTEKMYTWMRGSDFFMKGQTIVAALMHDKVKMKDGTEKSMWSLINADGTVNSDEIENWNSESQIDLIQKLNAIVKRTHGNTDPNSPVWIKSEVLGRLLGQFKLSWITEGINSRFGVSRPDEITGVKVQGRYVAIPRMFKEYNNFLRNSGAGSTMERWKDAFTNLDKTDQADIRKIAAEMIFFLSLWAMMIGLKMLKAELDDDDKFSKGSATLALNLIYRLRSDISFYALPSTLSDVIRNPVPALRVWTDFSKAAWSTIEVLNPINDTDQEDINRLGRNWAKTLPPLRSGVSIYKSTVDSYEDYNAQ